MKRTQMTSKERGSRSRLKPQISWGEFVRGTLTVRQHTCGTAGCKCYKGDKHKSMYISRSKNGKMQQLYIPKEKETQVKQWVIRYREVLKLLENISDSYWDRLKNRS